MKKHDVSSMTLKQNDSHLNGKQKQLLLGSNNNFSLEWKQEESYSGSVFYYKGFIHYEFIPEGKTVNKNIEILKSLQRRHQ